MTPAPLPREIVLMEAQRAMRLHHMLWHTARNGWELFSPAARAAFTKAGWAPPRPARNANGDPILTNNSGEDFLYMHHQMIAEVDAKLAQIADPAYPKVEGWTTFPAPGDADYPVPPYYSLGDSDGDAWLTDIKSDAYFTQTFQRQERQFEDDAVLRGLSMGELGARIEFTVHNTAHMRWSAKPQAFRPDPDPTEPTAVDPIWDDPAYDWLGDFYSSHVNAIFWKLHGWVDGRIDAWKAANGITGEYEWQGTWSGPMDMSDMHHHLTAAGDGNVTPELAAHSETAEELLNVASSEGLVASPITRVDL